MSLALPFFAGLLDVDVDADIDVDIDVHVGVGVVNKGNYV